MAQAAAEAAEKIRRALEDEGKAQARLEQVAYKDWKKIDIARKAAAKVCAEAHAAADAKVAREVAATIRAAPIVVVFTLPFRRTDVFKELSRPDDPLDYPSAAFRHDCKVQTGRQFEPKSSSGAGIFDTTRLATTFAPGFTRNVEQRFTLFGGGPFVTEELLEVRSPDLLRWRMHKHDVGGGPGATASSLPIVGEALDPKYVDGARAYNPQGGYEQVRVYMHGMHVHGVLSCVWHVHAATSGCALYTCMARMCMACILSRLMCMACARGYRAGARAAGHARERGLRHARHDAGTRPRARASVSPAPCLSPLPTIPCRRARVAMQIGVNGRFDLGGAGPDPSSIWGRCVSAAAGALTGCTRGIALGGAWSANMRARGCARSPVPYP